MRTLSAAFATSLSLLPSSGATAACLFPGTDKSGYKIPLVEEISTSSTIVVAKIVSWTLLSPEDSDDSDALVTIKTLRTLKGKTPKETSFHTANDSGGFRANPGEIYLLFLNGKNSELSVDTCGNYAQLPDGSATLDAVQRLLLKTTP